MSNIESSVSGSGLCSSMGGEDCAEYKNLAFLLVSLGITVILVGALFYYVRQRFEVLEVSHKEQIGVMRNFISSISEQFQRMNMMHHSQGVTDGGDGDGGVTGIQEHKSNQMQDQHEDRISISDDSCGNDSSDSSDGDYDDDSESSDTDTNTMDAYRMSGNNDIVFCNDDDASDDRSNLHINELSDIKIIELCNDTHTHTADEVGQDSDENDGESDDDSDGESDDSDDSDNSDNSDNNDVGVAGDANNIKRLIVIKTDSIVLKENDDVVVENRNMVIDLDLDEDMDAATNATTDTVTITSNTDTTTTTTPSYAQMSIKQLRQSVKRMNEHKHLDTSKLKRDQLIAMLS